MRVLLRAPVARVPGHGRRHGRRSDKIQFAKPRARALARGSAKRTSRKKEVVVFSGVNDCYQPLEAAYRLTRRCLEVCADVANPVAIITKAPLVERDIDLLQTLTRVASAHVTVSIPIWDVERARAIEPYVATPQRRLRVSETLARAGIEVGVNVAPIIPGLNDQDIPKILSAARDAGATHAGSVLLRLPGSVKAVFEERVRAALPLSADRVLHRIRETRGGQLYDSRFGARGRGEGTYALAIQTLFRTTARRLGFAHYETRCAHLTAGAVRREVRREESVRDPQGAAQKGGERAAIRRGRRPR